MRLIINIIIASLLIAYCYYAIWFLCLLNDNCYYQNFMS